VCVCVCVCVSPLSLVGNGSVKVPFIIARQRLGKNPLIIARQRLGKNPPIVATQRLGKNSLMVRNAELVGTCFTCRISFLFGIQQPTMIYRATIDFVSKITYSRSVVYDKLCAFSSHRFLIVFLCLITFNKAYITFVQGS
jgi:hypothetical protein